MARMENQGVVKFLLTGRTSQLIVLRRVLLRVPIILASKLHSMLTRTETIAERTAAATQKQTW